jgi:purine-binding chemotaxis protein CheW
MMNALVKAGAGQAASAQAEPGQYLTFMLSGETFAIGILGIKEIIEFAGLTSVPMMPNCVRGVINLRGAVVPVLDLAARFGREPSEVCKRTCIVIVETEHEGQQQVVGLMVDAVNAVIEIAASEIEPPPSFGARVRADFISGMGKVNGKFVIVLAIEQVLSVVDITSMLGTGQLAAEAVNAA